jgi:hypothetical protein
MFEISNLLRQSAPAHGLGAKKLAQERKNVVK